MAGVYETEAMSQLALNFDPPRLLRPDPLPAAKRQGDRAIAAGKAKALSIDPAFIERASAHIESYLRLHGVSSGELLVDSCRLNGIRSTSDKHFGCVFRRLLNRHVIKCVGEARRTRGHGSRGGSLYALVEVDQ